MPVNFTIDYYKAEEKFLNAKTDEERIIYLEEMIRVCPKHKGAENLLSQLHAKLARLKKDVEKKSERKGARSEGIRKEGYAQICLIGKPNVGKSTILKKITNADPDIDEYPYTTVRPEIAMMNYKGINLQVIEIPSTFRPEYMSISRTADLIAIIYRNDKDLKFIEDLLNSKYIRTKRIQIKYDEDAKEIKEKIWKALDMIIVYTKDSKSVSPMALKRGLTVKDFAIRIHKDFVNNFAYARLWRRGKEKQVGLNYVLDDGDIVEIHTKLK